MQEIRFFCTRKAKYFEEINTIIHNAVSNLRTKQSWKYGIFIISAKLPRGNYLWPALWLSGATTLPPEIDILEGYSNDTTTYKKGKSLYSNVHMTIDNVKSNIGGRKHFLRNKVTEEFIEYVLWWEKDFIKIYYNGYLVSKITDPKVLEAMYEPQKLIIGSSIQKKFIRNSISPLAINRVEVYQK